MIHETTNHRYGSTGVSPCGFYAENGLTYDLTDYAAANNWAEKFGAAAGGNHGWQVMRVVEQLVIHYSCSSNDTSWQAYLVW